MKKPWIHPSTPSKLRTAYRKATRNGVGYKMDILARNLDINIRYIHDAIHNGKAPNDSTPKLQEIRKKLGYPMRIRKPKHSQPQTPGTQQARDLFQTPAYAVDMIVPFLFGLPIWEPAAGQGRLARRLEEHQFTVHQTDIETGTNFLDCEVSFYYHIIITNPPYSLKRQFYEHCLELEKPFALLIPTDLCQWIINAVWKQGCQWLIPNSRINYITPNGKMGKESAAQFHSGWLTKGLNLPEKYNFVELTRKDKEKI